MRYVEIQGRRFSRIVCGTNAFYARSHFSRARDSEYQGRFTDDYLRQVIRRAVELGVNAIESCANERIAGLLDGLSLDDGSPLRFIGNTRIDATSTMKTHQQKLDHLLARRSDICVVHSQFVDRPRKGAEIGGLVSVLDRIHAAGLLAGISTHRVSTVELCEAAGYPIDVYLFPLNATGFVYPGYDGRETVAERVRVVQSCPKPFILMKTLGAGRIPPEEGLPFVLGHAKPNDLVSLGLGSLEEADESLAIADGLL